MTFEELKKKFDELDSKKQNNFFGFDNFVCPLNVLMGFYKGLPTLLIDGFFDCPPINSSDAVIVEVTHNPADKKNVYLLFSESESKFHDLFVSFCVDLLSVLDGITSAEKAVSALVARFEAWREFWKSGKSKFSEEKTRGLAGELLYLEKLIDGGMSARDAVRGWHGPLGHDQDFIFEHSWFEIKTIRQEGTQVTISSLEQLANPVSLIDSQNIDARLVIIGLQSNPVDSVNSFTLSSLHQRLVNRFKNDPWTLNNYYGTLELSGADMESGEMENNLKLALIEMKSYSVNSVGFPKLIRGMNIPDAVTKLSYNLSIPALQDWLIQE